MSYEAHTWSICRKGVWILLGCGVSVLVNATGCGSDGTSPATTGGAPEGPSFIEPNGTSIFIEVRNIETGAPIVDAVVSIAGQEIHSDEWGNALFEELSEGRIVAQVKASGFAPATAVAEVTKGAHVGAVVKLMQLDQPIPFDANVETVLRHSDVRVSIPANSLVYSNGELVAGEVTATIVPLDPTSSAIEAVPGPLVGVSGSMGETVELESIFMAEISLTQDGKPVNLAEGATAIIELPVPESLKSKYTPGTEIPSWSYSLDLGVWEKGEVGVIEVSMEDPERLIWVAPVHHFTWWNSDNPWTEKHCYDVLVVDDNGTPVGNMPLTGVGVSYVGISWTKHTTTTAGS